MQKIKSVIK